MVNFRDPNVILKDGWALVKLCHAIDSLYLWEFFTSLDYEWSVIRGRRPYRWTIWLICLLIDILPYTHVCPGGRDPESGWY